VPRGIENGGGGHGVAALRNVRARVDGASRNAALDHQASNADAAGGSGVNGHRLRDDLRLRGTFAPFFRASLKPIAIACLRLLTVPPLPPGPLFNVPFFRRRIADLTFFDADFPYFAMCHSNVAEFMSLELISKRETETVNGARIGKCRQVLNAELQVVLAAIHDRDAGAKYQPEAPAVFVVVAAPVPKAGAPASMLNLSDSQNCAAGPKNPDDWP
jgi:hypothetical protein